MLLALVAHSILALCTAVPAAKIPDVVPKSESNGTVAPGRDVATWNQSQHGKYNLHVSLNNVKIIAVMSNFYDDEEDSINEYNNENLDEIFANATAVPSDHLEAEEEEEDITNEQFIQPIAPSPKSLTSITVRPDKITTTREEKLNVQCEPGFFVDRLGRCRKIRGHRSSIFHFDLVPSFRGFRFRIPHLAGLDEFRKDKRLV